MEILVTPKSPTYWSSADREVVVFLDDIFDRERQNRAVLQGWFGSRAYGTLWKHYAHKRRNRLRSRLKRRSSSFLFHQQRERTAV